MTAYTASNMANVLNRLSGDRLYEGLNKQVPLIGIAKKRTDFGGEGKYLVLQYGVGGGQSATFANAQTNKSQAATARLFITRVTDYALASISNEAILASANDKFAVANLLKVAVDSAALSESRSLGIHAYRGGGYRCQLGSISSNTLTLAKASDASLFTVGMVIVADTAADGSGTRRANALTITRVNVSAGTLETTGTTTGWATNDYIARDGDFGAVISGLGAWIPSSTPSTLFGFDRVVAPEYLGGTRVTKTGTIEDAIIDTAAEVGILGGMPDVVMCNPKQYATLSKEIGSKDLVRSEVKSTLSGGRVGATGYDAIGVYAGVGRLDVIADPNCPESTMFLGKRDTLEMWSLGDLIGPVGKQINGGRVLEYNADAIELRIGGYMQTVVTEPWHWARITLA